MIHTGGRDRCYYNEFCYRVGGYDIPFNLMISDLVYMIHGLILVGVGDGSRVISSLDATSKRVGTTCQLCDFRQAKSSYRNTS